MNLSSYLRLTHASNCQCSVCWSHRSMSSPASSGSRPPGPTGHFSPDCTPAGRPFFKDGKWWCKPASCVCRLGLRKSRAPYWTVIEDRGTPVPFVPIREPFELE
ncbi:lysogeny maintenance protein PflM [Pseudomonas mangiferae]|uniref:lysogeny maintenance protein PflM n=1 Tax=Pseudomonas mangiferae TaxID=2593654 RepID=UPI0015B641EA